jgi:hypothetical protein
MATKTQGSAPARVWQKPTGRTHPGANGIAALAVAAVLFCIGWSSTAQAYTSAGDRSFPATLQLPQIAPGDEAYFNTTTQPLTSSGPGSGSRVTNLTGVFAKTITDRLGIFIEETYSILDQVGTHSAYGWQNHDMAARYLAVSDFDREFLLSLGVDRETGGTGALRVGASPSGATTPQLFFGKGLGDLDIGLLRPLAIAGYTAYGIADKAPRPDIVTSGFVVEYSVPYLLSKVATVDLPDILRSVTPMTEVVFTAPSGRSFGARSTALIAPGVSYAGEGWELAVEALLPATRATGRGVGVSAQFHLALDFFFPDTIGRPLFAIP